MNTTRQMFLLFYIYILQQNIFLKFHVNEETFPKFFLPQGRWRLWMNAIEGNVSVIEGSVFMDIIEYSSERQRNKFG